MNSIGCQSSQLGSVHKGAVFVIQQTTTRVSSRPLLKETATGLPLTLQFSGDGFGPSDHTNFYAKERPVLMFFTGPHVDYHRPSDTLAQLRHFKIGNRYISSSYDIFSHYDIVTKKVPSQ